MTLKMLTEVVVAGVDVSSRLRNWAIEESFGQEIRESTINFTSGIFDDIPTLENGATITIKRGTTTATDQFVFKGTVNEINKKGPEITLKGIDEMINLVRLSVTYSYDGVNFPSTEAKGSDIATDLIETWGGMTASVIDTGTAITLKKFICRGTDVFERLQTLANIWDYMIYYDPADDKVHFEPKGYVSNTNDLTVGGTSNNVSNLPKWAFDNTQCVNKLTVRGAMQEVQDTIYFNGDGSANQEFTFPKKPIATEVFEIVGGNNVLKIPGVESSTAGAFDYTVDKENATFEATSNWTPASGTDNIKVVYTNAIPVPVQVEDTSSQSKYGVCQAQKHFSDIQTVEDAEQRGNGWVSKYGTPFTKVDIKPYSIFDYEAGHKVQVTDNLNNESRELVINKIVKKYPHNGDVLMLGDKDWRLAEWGKFTLERIRRLEEENQRDADLVNQIKTFDHSANFHRRYLQANTKTFTGTGAIWDNPDHSIFNGAKWSDGTGMGSEEVQRIVWPNQKYIETFFDTDFKGSGTGTWDITNKELIL